MRYRARTGWALCHSTLTWHQVVAFATVRRLRAPDRICGHSRPPHQCIAVTARPSRVYAITPGSSARIRVITDTSPSSPIGSRCSCPSTTMATSVVRRRTRRRLTWRRRWHIGQRGDGTRRAFVSTAQSSVGGESVGQAWGRTLGADAKVVVSVHKSCAAVARRSGARGCPRCATAGAPDPTPHGIGLVRLYLCGGSALDPFRVGVRAPFDRCRCDLGAGPRV